MTTNLVAKWDKITYPLHLSLSHSCKNFVNCGPVTPEKTGLICVLFLRHGKKLAYLVKYLRIYWTDFYNLFTI